VWLCYGTVPALGAGSGLIRMAPEFPGNTSACTPTHRGTVILRSQHGPVPQIASVGQLYHFDPELSNCKYDF
jgi:hypothetical protein